MMTDGAVGLASRRSIGISAAALTAALLMGSAAWACTPQSTIYPLVPAAAQAGQRLAVSGELLQSGPADLRWNSLTGPTVAMVELADTLTRSFSAEVIVPNSHPGVHYLVLVSGDEVVARTALEVPASGGAESRMSAEAFDSDLSTSSKREPTEPLLLGVGLLTIGLVSLSTATFAAVRGRRRAYAAGQR